MSNTLDYFNIQSIVATISKTTLPQLPKFFIAQLSTGTKSTLALIQHEKDDIKIHVDENKHYSLSKEEFLTQWTGFIIVIEKNTSPWFKKNLENIILFSILILCSLSAFIYLGLFIHSLSSLLHLFLSIIGLIISYLIIREKVEHKSSVSRFCNLSENTDCNAVLKSKESKIFNLFDLSDASVVYFSFLTLALIYQPNSSLFLVLAVCSLPVIIYSLYSQYFQIKKWCPLCLGIASVLILQFIVEIAVNDGFDIDNTAILQLTFLLGITLLGWIRLKPMLLLIQERHALVVENLTFRRNYDLFLPYYNSLKEVNKLLETIPKIKMGAKHPLITLTAITNPLCKICFHSHKIYMDLLKKYPDELRIDFLFLVPDRNRNNPKTQIAERQLQIYMEDDDQVFNKAFNEWYEEADVHKWLNQWGANNDIGYNHLLQQQVSWCLQNGIDSTPAMLINGKLFPLDYRPEDIENFIAPILSIEKESATHQNEIMHDKTETLNVYK